MKPGIVNATNYAAANQLLQVRDSDKVLQQFFSHCVQAGPELCTFAGSAKTAGDLESKFYKIVDALQTAPVVVIKAHNSTVTEGVNTSKPGVANSTIVVTSDYLKKWTFGALYEGFQFYPSFSAALTYIEQAVFNPHLPPIYLSLDDIASSFFPSLTVIQAQQQQRQSSSKLCAQNETTVIDSIAQNDVYEFTSEQAIACSDGEDIPGTTAIQYLPFLKQALASSKLVGQNVASFRLACTNWLIRPVLRFAGPFTAANTKTPILVVSNIYDPITPYVDGVRVHQDYKNSGFLVINATGHSSLNTGSICAFESIATYLNDGVLPAEGTVCQSAVIPFDNSTSSPLSRRDVLEGGVVRERDFDLSGLSRVVKKSLPLLMGGRR